MRPLDLTAAPQFVLSFDFDGTLHNPAETPPLHPGFFGLIRRLREARGAVWGINTGRSMAHVIEGLIESHFPFTPDWASSSSLLVARISARSARPFPSAITSRGASGGPAPPGGFGG